MPRGYSLIGLRESNAALANMGPLSSTFLSGAGKNISKLLAKVAKQAAPGKTKRSISPYQDSAVTAGIKIESNPEYSIARFFGMNKRSGWYAAQQFSGSTGRQFPPWVGNEWNPGDQYGKPYYIGDPINAAVNEVQALYGIALDRAATPAFPIPGPRVR